MANTTGARPSTATDYVAIVYRPGVEPHVVAAHVGQRPVGMRDVALAAQSLGWVTETFFADAPHAGDRRVVVLGINKSDDPWCVTVTKEDLGLMLDEHLKLVDDDEGNDDLKTEAFREVIDSEWACLRIVRTPMLRLVLPDEDTDADPR